MIFGCGGPELSADERDLFAEINPLGLILFQRNCGAPARIARLVAEFRRVVGRPEAPVLIDQEGGRVARLGAPHWHPPPAAGRIGALHAQDPARARHLAWLAGRVIAHDLGALGISVACAPVLDVQQRDAHQVIGDRSFGDDPGVVASLGRAMADGLLAGGVLPVVKHIPGHGRAMTDSHLAMPVVDCPATTLRASDLVPFRALADMPLAMTAHVRYLAWDPDLPATISPRVIARIIRGEIGFDGLLLSDDIGMDALGGSLGERAEQALRAGCDVVLHCSGVMAEMLAVGRAARAMDAGGLERWRKASRRLRPPEPFDPAAGVAALTALGERKDC